MFELYLITRLDGISNLLTTITIVSFLAVIIFTAANSDEEKAQSIYPRRWGVRGLIFALISGTINSFTPTTKEALIIFGVGGAIEYFQENPTSKELPDKVIKCIDKLLDEYLIEETEDQSNRNS